LILGIIIGFWASPAQGYITALYPLKNVLAGGQFIFMAKVEKIDPDKPALILEVIEKLKGQSPFDKLPMNLTGDSEGQKSKHTPQLLKRLATDLPVVVFVNQRGKRYEAFVYSNGTWFQTIGHIDKDDSTKVRWAFTHCEPYLRRTFKGTTADLRQTVIDGLSGKKVPPEPDPKEPPGLGPELKTEDRGAKIEARRSSAFALQSSIFDPRSSSATWAVIPTFVIMGPLALLATLFPAVFGGLAFFMRRWMALLSIACFASTLYWLHHWFQGKIRDHWWGTPTALWITLALLSAIGVGWSWRRHRSAWVGPDAEAMKLKRGDVVVLRVLSLVGLAVFFYCLGTGDLWLPAWKKETLAIWTAIWVGTIYAWIRLSRMTRPVTPPSHAVHGSGRGEVVNAPVAARPGLAAEGLMLGVLGLAFIFLGTVGQREIEAITQASPLMPGNADPVPLLKGVVWEFSKDQGNFSSSPLVVGDRIYQAAFHQSGFSAFGALYCLNRSNGKELLWKFDDDGDMKPVFSTPCLDDGRLYIGEGFHQDSNCKLYCLEAATGKKLWDFPTASHTESSPCVADGKVFFGAGEDGVFCLDAKSGKELWHFQGLHVDTNLTVSGHQLFGGSGYNGNAIFCLDIKNGDVLWQKSVDLPCFASPTYSGDRVFFGLGNGDFISSDEKPAGAVLCASAKTGDLIWRFDVPDAVHGKPAVDHHRIYFGSRDGFCYCLDKQSGELIWKQSMGSPVVSSVVLARCPHCGNCTGLYAAGSNGKMVCLGANTGQVNWTLDLSRRSQTRAQLFSTPALVMEADDNGQHSLIYVGAGLTGPLNTAAVLYCLQDELMDH
jgi:outer membrane protein assembly factor BamB